MSSPLVSVILPVYNGESFLRETIISVLSQTYPSFELIVVDDGSSDSSKGITQEFSDVRYVYQANQGVPFARNAGAATARGVYLCFIDQDDLWMPDKLKLQVNAFYQNPDLGYTITRQVFYLSDGLELPEWCQPEWLNRPLAGFSPSTLMIRNSVFNAIGKFDTTLLTGSDVEFFFQLKDRSVPYVQLEEILVRKRIHSSNHSAARDLLRKDIFETVRRSIQRQRGHSL